jgi:hypothetical protein
LVGILVKTGRHLVDKRVCPPNFGGQIRFLVTSFRMARKSRIHGIPTFYKRFGAQAGAVGQIWRPNGAIWWTKASVHQIFGGQTASGVIGTTMGKYNHNGSVHQKLVDNRRLPTKFGRPKRRESRIPSFSNIFVKCWGAILWHLAPLGGIWGAFGRHFGKNGWAPGLKGWEAE